MDKAKELGIHLLFLPPYSPNLNLIERLWKFTKKKCLYNQYYESFDRFKEAIDDCCYQQCKNEPPEQLKSEPVSSH